MPPLRNSEWVVYSKRPFGGPEEVLRYLARYAHRVAISDRRLVSLDDKGVTFRWKDYRPEGPERYKQMTLDTHEFIRRFLMHVLPQGFHRIRYHGFLTCQTRARNIAPIRQLLAVPLIPVDADETEHLLAILARSRVTGRRLGLDDVLQPAVTMPSIPRGPRHPRSLGRERWDQSTSRRSIVQRIVASQTHHRVELPQGALLAYLHIHARLRRDRT